ncbi:MAG: hypothetical protein JXA37_05605 [Chloroflexia bacterium]|nr:hypothetical protein [Chloroflexia bacterium]
MDELNRRRIIGGTILILLGIAFLAQQFIHGLGDSAFLFIIGGAFLVAYFVRQAYGLLIPGCILVGLGLGSIGENTFIGVGDFSALGLGIGFIAIYVIARIYQGDSHWWPLIPGGILILVGVASLTENLGRIFSVGWPLLLVLIGLLLLAGAFGLFDRAKRE